jgi:hypothetical protein
MDRHLVIFRPMAMSAIAICLCVTAAVALEPVMIVSYGSNNCERFVRASRPEKQMYLSWTEGYVSAANTRDAGTGRMAGIFWNQAANAIWLQSYCTQNPQDGFLLAAEALRTALGGHKSK